VSLVGINTDPFKKKLPAAIRQFWAARELATDRQRNRGVSDQGNRGGVTAGKNLDGVIGIIKDLIVRHGIPEADVHVDGRVQVTLPGFYRPTKAWDLLVVNQGRLIAAVEFKSQVGPSFGNNFNNRVEEAIGSATDLSTAFRVGAFGESKKPFLGYFFVLEKCKSSTEPVSFHSPHFAALPEFENTSYARRYELLCRKLVQERLYDAAALVLTSASKPDPPYESMSELTSPRGFMDELAGKIVGSLGN
jgi:hypothetical protein